MRKHCIPGNRSWPTIATVLLLLLQLLQLVHGEQQAEDHRIQRRFMWQQMDNSVMGGLMGRMFHSARAMKTMFGDLLPSTAGYAKSMLDFLPTETTRVKYIIRDPHTNKPMKIIKMRGTPKKVVKMIRPLPKPAITEPTPLQYENRMRQLEKEQELIVEGKLPMSSDEALMNKYFKQKSRPSSNEIVSGKIMEYQSWKPVYKPGEQPSSFVTLRPQPLTQLHTDIVSSTQEQLPKPEKLIAQRPELDEEDDDFEQVEDENELSRPNHQYEVTEHTGEASGEVQSLAPLEGGFVPSYHHLPSNSVSSVSAVSNSHHVSRPRQRGSSTPSSIISAPISSTEAPNYPAAFLKKYREREAEAAVTAKPSSRNRPKQAKQQRVHGASEYIPATNVSFAMSSLRARLQEQQRQSKQEQQDAEMEAALIDAMNGGKWPAEVEQTGSYLTSPIGPSAVAFDQPVKFARPEHKRQKVDPRQRGTIKFSDNPGYDEV